VNDQQAARIGTALEDVAKALEMLVPALAAIALYQQALPVAPQQPGTPPPSPDDIESMKASRRAAHAVRQAFSKDDPSVVRPG